MQRDYADARLHEMCQNTEQKELQAIEQLVFKESTKEKGREGSDVYQRECNFVGRDCINDVFVASNQIRTVDNTVAHHISFYVYKEETVLSSTKYLLTHRN